MSIQISHVPAVREAEQPESNSPAQIPLPIQSTKEDRNSGFFIERSKSNKQEIEKTNPLLIAIAVGLSIVVAGLFLFQKDGRNTKASDETIALSSLKTEFAKLELSGLLPNDLTFQSLQAATAEVRKGNTAGVRPFFIHLRDTCNLKQDQMERNTPEQKALQLIINYCNANI
ncbi:hypothetical protein N9N28_15635 [Rubripirellula amarantea]|nr:hypothetical protein [Rubripirellula amarantea]